MIIWAAEYCPMTCESDFGIIALCRTKKVAMERMRLHRKEQIKFWRMRSKYERWRVKKYEVVE